MRIDRRAASAAIVQEQQLLLGDAIIVAMMQGHGVVHLATNDDDFDRVPCVTIWKPRPAEPQAAPKQCRQPVLLPAPQ